MTTADLDAVMEIEKASFGSPWSRRSFEAELAMNSLYSHLLVATRCQQVVGFICFQYVIDDAHIINFAVHPEHRRCGYGRWLLQQSLVCAHKLGVDQVVLEVRVSNRAAIKLYQQAGFQLLALRRRFYSDNGEDAYVMAKRLGKS